MSCPVCLLSTCECYAAGVRVTGDETGCLNHNEPCRAGRADCPPDPHCRSCGRLLAAGVTGDAGLREHIEGLREHAMRQGTWGIEYGDDRFYADVIDALTPEADHE